MFRNMVTSLFTYGKIRTTDAKAKELRRWADHMITLAKRGDLHARRQAMSVVRSKNVVQKLFDEVSERFGSRAGGYTRIIKIGRRHGDAAPISLVELVGLEEPLEKKKSKAAKKTAAKAKKETTAKPQLKEVTASEKVEAAEKDAPKVESVPQESGENPAVSSEETAEKKK
jgi:large subunit ribosomal protein L17